jgi:3-dehydroquinate synthetase
MKILFNSNKSIKFHFDNKKKFKDFILQKKIFFFVDIKLKNFFLSFLEKKIRNKNKIVKYMEAKESLKNFNNVEKILRFFYKHKLTSYDHIIVAGGGTIIDLTSFCASIYKRGIDYSLIPTTTMSSVDTASGGKTCINFQGVKNLIGSFHYPKNVFLFDKFLATEPRKIKIAGITEIFKYGLIGSKKILKLLQNKNYNKIKKKLFIETILTRYKIRKINPLASNLGHTFAHAIERLIPISHGNAVSLGIIFESYFALEKNIIKKELFLDIVNMIKKLNLNINFPSKLNLNKVIKLMLEDKKSKKGYISFVFIKNFQELYFNKSKEPFYHAQPEEVRKALIYFYENRKMII